MRVENGVVGSVSMSTVSGFSERNLPARRKMSLLDMCWSMVTFLIPMPMSWLIFKGFRVASAFFIMRRMKSCWRWMRPRSPVGSVCQRPPSSSSKCRLRAHARAWKPSRWAQPAVLMLRPLSLSRAGAGT